MLARTHRIMRVRLTGVMHATHDACCHAAQVTAWQQKRAKEKLRKLCDLFLKGKSFLVGEQFTVADAYLYIVLSWVEGPLKLGPLSDFAEAKAFYDRVRALPNVQAAHKRMAENPKTVV